MDHTWMQQRPHLAPLARTLDAVLKLADELYEQGRAGGESVDYAAFEERVASATAAIEQGVHQVALSGLDVDKPYIRVWGKHYCRRCDPLTSRLVCAYAEARAHGLPVGSGAVSRPRASRLSASA